MCSFLFQALADLKWKIWFQIDIETKKLIGYKESNWTPRPDRKFYNSKRTNLVAWYIDDCTEAKTIREDYVSYMENYIKVDIYGKCGNKDCLPEKVLHNIRSISDQN